MTHHKHKKHHHKHKKHHHKKKSCRSLSNGWTTNNTTIASSNLLLPLPQFSTSTQSAYGIPTANSNAKGSITESLVGQPYSFTYIGVKPVLIEHHHHVEASVVWPAGTIFQLMQTDTNNITSTLVDTICKNNGKNVHIHIHRSGVITSGSTITPVALIPNSVPTTQIPTLLNGKQQVMISSSVELEPLIKDCRKCGSLIYYKLIFKKCLICFLIL